MNPQQFLELLRKSTALQEGFYSLRDFEPRQASHQIVSREMHPALKKHLEHAGFSHLYLHQAKAFDAAMEGENLVVVTSTGSGKSLCYHLPVLQSCLTEPVARALYLFPTKALAQDQFTKLSELIPIEGIRCGVYDGDTPASHRRMVRQNAHVILTNPDMLHVGILPQHEQWTSFLKSLRWIVLDEMHVYGGVFGSHVASILKRLLRLCTWHHSNPQIIACSATITQPEVLFNQLTGKVPKLIDEDSSFRSSKHFAFCAPPQQKEAVLSPHTAAAELLAHSCSAGIKTLVFCHSRLSMELVLKRVKDFLKEKKALVEGYRGGYTPKIRRKIEKQFLNGELKGLVSTSAMELGVDVGDLDLVILDGYPGDVTRFWQQMGRAGREKSDGFGVMIAHEDPLEHFLMHHPELIFDKIPDPISMNPCNQYVLSGQLSCASYERAIASDELNAFCPSALDVVSELVDSGALMFRAGRYYYPSYQSPSPAISIRGFGGKQVKLYAGEEHLGNLEEWRALQEVYPGAVYLHRGVAYNVKKLDLKNAWVELMECEENEYTRPIVHSFVEPKIKLNEKEIPGAKVTLLGLEVIHSVSGYQRISLEGYSVLSVESLDLPPITFNTVGIRLDLDAEPLGVHESSDGSSVHGLEHAMMAVAPYLGGCTRQEIGSIWYNIASDTLCPAVYVFDNLPGGMGLSERLYAKINDWVSSANQLLEVCSCLDGCPRCLLSSNCEVSNQFLDKQGTLKLLKRLLNFTC